MKSLIDLHMDQELHTNHDYNAFESFGLFFELYENELIFTNNVISMEMMSDESTLRVLINTYKVGFGESFIESSSY